VRPAKTIGIVGGLGPESTIAFYGDIAREYHRRFGDYAYPAMVIYSLSFQEIIDAGYRTSKKVLHAIEALAAAGADFAVAACNSIHTVHEELSDRAPIPWISITEATADAVESAGIKSVALLGTKITMAGDFFPRALSARGIACRTPDTDDRERINRIIFEELVVGDARDESRRRVLEIIERLRCDGAAGVILGCTELPFLIRPEDTNLPLFDTNRLLAHKALQIAIGPT